MKIKITLLLLIIIKLSIAQNTATYTQVGPIKFPSNPSIQTTGMGRVSQLVYHPTDSNILYAVSASGGVFKSSNEGSTWTPICDNLPLTACASLLINPLNPKVMYLGTGDANYDGNGLGVYKTTNGGITWTQFNSGMGNILVSKMQFTPGDTQTIIAACKDGIYKTINGGSTWVKKTTVNSSYRDLSYRPQSNSIVYASTNTFFYRSYNNGETWIQSNLNSSITCAGIQLAVCPSDTSKIYCVVWKTGGTSPFGGIYTSTNNGVSFNKQVDTPNILGYSNNGITMDGQGAYNLALIVDPTNANTIYIGAINLWKSTNGGTTFNLLSHWAFGVHADKHHFLFSPFNNNKLYISHDGGIDRTLNGGTSWTTIEDGLSASEFYKMAASGIKNDYLIGGLQDNGKDVAVNKNFATVTGGDWTGDFEFDNFDSSIVYENGGVKRNIITHNTSTINGHNGIYLAHPKDSNVMFEMDSSLLRTNNLRSTVTSSIVWNQLFINSGIVKTGTKCMAYSKPSSGTFYIAFSPQLFYRSENINSSSPSFSLLTGFPFITGEVIKQIETVNYDSNSVYVVTNLTRIFKSANKGVTWTQITKNLTSSSFIKFELDQINTDSSMYVCTAFGVFFRNSSMVNWIPFVTGLPSIARISDMEIMNEGTNNSRLYISTYGRGIWQSNLYNNSSKAPIADFTMQSTSNQSCPNTFILTNHSINAPTSTKWSITPNTGFQYINGTDSFSQRAEIIFNNSGSYLISLIASNNSGTNIKSMNFNNSTSTTAPCLTTTTTNGGTYGIGIQKFELNTINNLSSIGGPSNVNYSCLSNTILKAGTTYTAWVTTGTTNPENQSIYIDYNNNGVFTDPNELVGTIGSGTGRRSCNINILSTPPLPNQFLRLRVVTNFSTNPTPSCGVLSYGESEDYAIFIDTIKPRITLSIPKPSVNGVFTVQYTASENIFDFTNSDIVITNGTSYNFTQTGPFTYTSNVSPTLFGKVVLTINANSFADLAGNTNLITKDSTTFALPSIETSITSKTMNFGPNEIDTFYSNNGNMMAVLINNSSYNYGATTVYIDSAGNGATNYSTNTIASKRILKKTYKVIPTNNNINGNFNIKMFYTAAEINGWKTITGNNFSSNNIIKCPNNIASGTLSNGVYGLSKNISSYGGTNDSVISATFNTGFSGFGVGIDVLVLPVKYLFFNAEKVKYDVYLNWSTASEFNNKCFEVERSLDYFNFEKIGVVSGSGNSNLVKNYAYIDLGIDKLKSKYIYYRLKQIDFNGNFEYSTIKVIENEAADYEITVYPQPVTDILKIKTKELYQYRFEIVDANGRLVLKGSNYNLEAEVDISSLKSGLYYLNILSIKKDKQTFKIIKID